MELKDWLKTINQTKENVMDQDPSLEKEYSPYIINRCLSGFVDSIMFANEMNQYYFLPKKMQYDFLLNSLRKKYRFTPWVKKETQSDIEVIKKYYGYSNQKAQQALKILTKDQIKFIKSKFETGGKR